MKDNLNNQQQSGAIADYKNVDKIPFLEDEIESGTFSDF